MKQFYRALCAIAILLSASSAMAQGTLPLALSQTLDINGKPQAGALLYTFVTGTVAQPQTSFQDTALSLANPWPLVADQNGRIPMFYLPNGSTHVRLTDSAGNVQYDNPNVLVIGPSGGSSSGGSVDPTTVLATGDLKVKYGTGAMSGFVRANGLTLGNVTSGATERANADTQNLFIYLYAVDPNLVVSGGRTGNALNDYNASKTITLPDWRGKTIFALADMGNSTFPSGLTSALGGCTSTTLGAWCGFQSNTLFTANLPPYTPTGAISNGAITINHNAMEANNSSTTPGGAFGSPSDIGATITASQATSTFSGNAQGGASAAFTNIPPALLATIYLKL